MAGAIRNRATPRPRAGLLLGTISAMLPLGLFLGLALSFLPATLDDAYIAMTFARNWATGHGLVFNYGERIEGFSSPLWVALLAGLAWLGLPLEVTARGLGLAAGCASVALLAATATPPDGRIHGGRIAAWLLAGSGGFAFYAVAGLETALYSFLILATAVVWQPRPRAKQAALLATLALLAAAARPEGVLVLALVVASLLTTRGTPQVVALGTVAATAALLAIRHAYFGAWLPNTFLAKPGAADLSGLIGGLGYLHDGLVEDGRYLDLGLALVTVAVLRSTRAWARPLAAAAAVGFVFVVWSGGDWMARSRFLVPYLPALCLLAGAALAAASARRPAWRPAIVALLIVLVGARAVRAVNFAAELHGGGIHDHAHVSTGNVAVGRWLAANTPKGSSVVTDEIGAIGFYSERRVLDFWGLVDREVADIIRASRFNPYATATAATSDSRRKLQERITQALLARDPDYALVDYRGASDRAVDPKAVNPVTMRELDAELRRRGYEVVRRFPLDRMAHKAFMLYRSPDASPLAEDR